MKKKIGLFYKQGGVFNNAVLTVDKTMIEILGVSREDNKVIFSFKDSTVSITKGTAQREVEIKDENGNLIEYVKTLSINFSLVSKNKTYYVAKLNIPFTIVCALKLTKGDNEVNMIKQGGTIIMRKVKPKRGRSYMVSVKKGGTAKTLTAGTLAHAITEVFKKEKITVLLISIDPQNDHVFNFMKLDEIRKYDKLLSINENGEIDIKVGLKRIVLEELDYKDYTIEVRKGVKALLLESDIFTFNTEDDLKTFKEFKEKFNKFYEKAIYENDYIIIDGVPLEGIDQFLLDTVDKVIIPVVPEDSAIKGTIAMINRVGIEKVFSILISRYRNTSSKNYFVKLLKETIKDTDIFCPDIIKEMSQIETLMKNKKTIFDSQSKYLNEVKAAFVDLALEMQEEKEKEAKE